jgi:hypothetical protein
MGPPLSWRLSYTSSLKNNNNNNNLSSHSSSLQSNSNSLVSTNSPILRNRDSRSLEPGLTNRYLYRKIRTSGGNSVK